MTGKRRLLPLNCNCPLPVVWNSQLLISVDRVYMKNQEVSCQFNKHENWPVVFTSWSFLPEVLSLRVYNHCLLHLKSNFLVFEYIFGRMSRGKIQAQRSCTSLLTPYFGSVFPALPILHVFHYDEDKRYKKLWSEFKNQRWFQLF